MLDECLEALRILPEGTYLDCTVGGGGHFFAMAHKLSRQGTLIGIDRDPEAVEWVRARLEDIRPRVILAQSNFSRFDAVLNNNGIERVDGILLDLGVSSRQLDDPHKGFTYRSEAPLDMRMNPRDTTTARDIVLSYSEGQLAGVLSEYGEVRNAARMAAAIKRCAQQDSLQTSADLRRCLEQEYGSSISFKALSKLFQALRIAVNDELAELRTALSRGIERLSTDGRLVVLSYHSLEDRIVKRFIRGQEGACRCPETQPYCTCNRVAVLKRINRRALQAGAEERSHNPRARSARMRVAEKVS
jgi:16S rRNA (cytosine1402-N4)-methyltransferase